jgi:hypothetical protein
MVVVACTVYAGRLGGVGVGGWSWVYASGAACGRRVVLVCDVVARAPWGYDEGGERRWRATREAIPCRRTTGMGVQVVEMEVQGDVESPRLLVDSSVGSR